MFCPSWYLPRILAGSRVSEDWKLLKPVHPYSPTNLFFRLPSFFLFFFFFCQGTPNELRPKEPLLTPSYGKAPMKKV